MSKFDKIARKHFIEETIYGMSVLVGSIERDRNVSSEELFESYITTTKGLIISNLNNSPKGQNPSEEAKRIAEKYKISLDDGKTIVDTHSRKVKIKL